jgi:hypothetical protein
MSNVYDIGDCVKFSVSFTNDAGVATDPTAVTLDVQDPSGNEITYTYAAGTVTKSATGAYYKTVVIDEAGEWYYRWAGTGAVVAAAEAMIWVRESEFD